MTDRMSPTAPPRGESFRAHARAWLEQHARRVEPGVLSFDERFEFASVEPDALGAAVTKARIAQADLWDGGLAAISWPTEVGGAGLGVEEELIYAEEAAGYDLPNRLLTMGLNLCSQLVMLLGTEEQKARLLQPTARGRLLWCQLFSEPDAGSDLASIRSRATKVDGGWRLDGQKIWTSYAHCADYGIGLLRTSDPVRRRQDGLSIFVVPMSTPGIEVRPIRQMTGGSTYCEVRLDGAVLGDEALLGEVDHGWPSLMRALSLERAAIGTRGGGRTGPPSAELIATARRRGVLGAPGVRERLVDAHIAEQILGYLSRRITSALRAGAPLGAEVSVAKLASARLAKSTSSLECQLLGPEGMACAVELDIPPWHRLLGAPAASMGGGTDEIQMNVLAERVLGLPADRPPMPPPAGSAA